MAPMATRKKTRAQWLAHALVSFVFTPYFKVLAALVVVAAIVGGGVVLHYYNEYATVIDRRLNGEIFQLTAKIYARPYVLYPQQVVTRNDVLTRLRRAGFQSVDSQPEEDGVYQLVGGGETTRIVVSPNGQNDYRLDFGGGRLDQIYELPSGYPLERVELPPELLTSLFDDTRSRRRVIDWEQIPQHLVDALIASEDQRFYRHFGIDPIRAAGVVLSNWRGGSLQGASTITMQLAGSFFLNRSQRTWSRKLPEIFMALILEQRLTKDEILALYANEIYLGHRGSFGIYGFGEAAAVYFGKDISQLTIAEAATLVGVLPAPSAYSPWTNPDRALQRRNLVLKEMLDLGTLTEEQYTDAAGREIALANSRIDTSEAPYMVDYIREELLDDFSEDDLISEDLRVYSTIDPDLQRAAVQAVDTGLQSVYEQLEVTEETEHKPQAALIVVDPHTGEILAMVCGSDYTTAPLNRCTDAFRQPGSIFKPVVYAAAFESAWSPLAPDFRPAGTPDPPEPEDAVAAEPSPGMLFGGLFDVFGKGESSAEEAEEPEEAREVVERDPDAVEGELAELTDQELIRTPERGTLATDVVITPITTVMDEPTFFFYGQDKYYEPSNFADEFNGLIPVAEGLRRSLNVPTVKVAERVGYQRVADLAHRLGLNGNIQPYPSIALGAFEVTPIEMAGAYTAFANEGVRMTPRAIREIRGPDGGLRKAYPMESELVLRPEMAALMTHLLQDVVGRGTGVRVGQMGFTLPAAGKTGTSRDGWFAGYTTDLLAIAWVGYDDNQELNLEGAKSALPIWTEFMLDAYRIHPVREGQRVQFYDPPGVEVVAIDPTTGFLATPNCPESENHAFITGTTPTGFCPLHSGGFFSSSGNPVSRAVQGIGRALGDLF